MAAVLGATRLVPAGRSMRWVVAVTGAFLGHRRGSFPASGTVAPCRLRRGVRSGVGGTVAAGLVQFGILGSLEVKRDDGSPVALGGLRQRAVLARLLMDRGTVSLLSIG